MWARHSDDKIWSAAWTSRGIIQILSLSTATLNAKDLQLWEDRPTAWCPRKFWPFRDSAHEVCWAHNPSSIADFNVEVRASCDHSCLSRKIWRMSWELQTWWTMIQDSRKVSKFFSRIFYPALKIESLDQAYDRSTMVLFGFIVPETTLSLFWTSTDVFCTKSARYSPRSISLFRILPTYI